MDLYKRFGRISFYLNNKLLWFRVRDRNTMPEGFFFQIGKEYKLRE